MCTFFLIVDHYSNLKIDMSHYFTLKWLIVGLLKNVTKPKMYNRSRVNIFICHSEIHEACY